MPNDRLQGARDVCRALGVDDPHLVLRDEEAVAGRTGLGRQDLHRHPGRLHHLEVVQLVVEDKVVDHVGIGRKEPERHPVVLLLSHFKKLEVCLACHIGARSVAGRELPRHRERRVHQVDPDARLHIAGYSFRRREERIRKRDQDRHESESEGDLRDGVQHPSHEAAPEAAWNLVARVAPRMSPVEQHQAASGEERGGGDRHRHQNGRPGVAVSHLRQIGGEQILQLPAQELGKGRPTC